MAQGLQAADVRRLYEAYAPVVYRRALQLLRREADAWDIVQEVFARMLQAGEHFRGEARPMTYVYRATTNACFNHLRSRSVREPSLLDDVPLGEASFVPGAPEAANFLRALAVRLDERTLQIAVMHFLDGLTQQEVAQVLKVSRKTVVRAVGEIRAQADALREPREGRDHG
jgi:RNA polymerase sigma-70 factor (ECF subfamily)